MEKVHIHMRFDEPVLGTSPADPDIYRRYIASKSEDATKIEEEVASLGVDAVAERGMTVFPRLDDGCPFIWDYQVKGFMKDACGMLRRADDGASKKLRAYKKEIDGLIFPSPRKIPYMVPEDGEIGIVERPLRASTPQGDRVALTASETLPVGTTLDFDVSMLTSSHMKYLVEWFSYGQLRGFGQWRNASYGRFHCTITDESGKVIFSNE